MLTLKAAWLPPPPYPLPPAALSSAQKRSSALPPPWRCPLSPPLCWTSQPGHLLNGWKPKDPMQFQATKGRSAGQHRRPARRRHLQAEGSLALGTRKCARSSGGRPGCRASLAPCSLQDTDGNRSGVTFRMLAASKHRQNAGPHLCHMVQALDCQWSTSSAAWRQTQHIPGKQRYAFVKLVLWAAVMRPLGPAYLPTKEGPVQSHHS